MLFLCLPKGYKQGAVDPTPPPVFANPTPPAAAANASPQAAATQSSPNPRRDANPSPQPQVKDQTPKLSTGRRNKGKEKVVQDVERPIRNRRPSLKGYGMYTNLKTGRQTFYAGNGKAIHISNQNQTRKRKAIEDS
ncbi:hypothetical protein PTKIN_Ptkin05aG0020200 [Pterospermum kingtungense]